MARKLAMSSYRVVALATDRWQPMTAMDSDSMNTTPQFTTADAQRLAHESFGLSGAVSALPSERDQNFALSLPGRLRYVLKIAKSDEDPAVLEFQNAAFEHLSARCAALNFPKVISSKSGLKITAVEDRSGTKYLMRLVTWLEGDVYVQVRPHDAKLLGSLGRALAEVDKGFEGFSHPAMMRKLHWDLRHIDLALTHLERLPNKMRHLVEQFKVQWETVPWPALRKSVIHGDANDYNVLVRSGRVAGLIDFGDMVYSARLCDLAIGVAYAMLDQAEPLAAASTVVAAYHENYPLDPAEIMAVYPLAVSRLCMSMCYAAHNAVAKHGDEYQLVTVGPASKLLEYLQTVPFENAQRAIGEACGRPAQLVAGRRRLFGGNLSLAYREPLTLVRGSMQYLFDEDGRQYLDAYNNVPHVGHCHTRVVEAARAQISKLNTNTRYLSEIAIRYAQQLVDTLPGALKVCFFVNSGSEANELAIRLARAHTGQRDLIVLEQAYHGNTNTLIDISPYKHSGRGGQGTPDWVQVAQLPDLYRGPYKRRDPAAGSQYAASVIECIEAIEGKGRGLSGYIAESWPSVGGQMDFPPGYLPSVYAAVRAAGGVCIADEVQTGYGRLGRHFWGFETYGVEPDIVVLGKPIGNGHPIGAVITTAEIAASFDNGMEFFSTFGGSTLSCAIGSAVLEVVLEEKLQAHGLEVGDRLLSGLRDLMAHHSLIGDVRGSGLFLGVELVRDRATLEPATKETSEIINHMCTQGVLLGSEGAFHNVLKIRPPMPFNGQDAEFLLERLDEALAAISRR
ncbi:MAG: aminotransferase class III-fold pyridoxal phosphate-dependent enzyme [Pseudomonadota bacterium]|nr:aminotransferase class III-fold pyridoxal phosphate-dependent enzyme [Pseudomonadota bacterium]